ncbi:hypothetical protein J5Y04_18865 [Kitasatospora sp. RG8]|uniref:hypothetical protein n=1 Tax=Kitasatospora sp. RG8 TaxID=2820815 RepID=UPI001ADEC858|nr:hypothetical protein [Kitasatospora sp. RG8]MBP0451591.1 hypothetical protein [Kitasatospora sp. RG8]
MPSKRVTRAVTALLVAGLASAVLTAVPAQAETTPQSVASVNATLDGDVGGAGQGPITPSEPGTAPWASATSNVSAPSLTRSQVINRAASWVDIGLKYNGEGSYQGYRTDCSGYVSMAWKLSYSLTTPEFVPTGVTSRIGKEDLKPGDALLNDAYGNDGHIVLFERWVDSSHNSYMGYEFSGSGVHHREIPYPYFPGTRGNPYRPVRNNSIVDDATPTPPKPTANNRTLETIQGGALHEVYTKGSAWHDSPVPGVGNLSALAFAYSPSGQRVIEAVENGALHEIYTAADGWHDEAVPVSGTIDSLAFAFDPNTGHRVIEAVEGGTIHEIYTDSNGWHEDVIPGVANVSALDIAYSPAGRRVIQAVENGALHEIYADSDGWHDNVVPGVGGNISALGFAFNKATGQRVIEAVGGGVLHEIYSDGEAWRDNVVPGVSGNITSVSVKVKATGDRVVELVNDGVLHEVYSDSTGWHDNVVPGTAGSASAVSFDLTL